MGEDDGGKSEEGEGKCLREDEEERSGERT